MLGFDGISSFAVSTVKETGCISLYWGVIVFFSSLSFWGVGERGGMVLLHVNDPPFFTTPIKEAISFFAGADFSGSMVNFRAFQNMEIFCLFAWEECSNIKDM